MKSFKHYLQETNEKEILNTFKIMKDDFESIKLEVQSFFSNTDADERNRVSAGVEPLRLLVLNQLHRMKDRIVVIRNSIQIKVVDFGAHVMPKSEPVVITPDNKLEQKIIGVLQRTKIELNRIENSLMLMKDINLLNILEKELDNLTGPVRSLRIW